MSEFLLGWLLRDIDRDTGGVFSGIVLIIVLPGLLCGLVFGVIAAKFFSESGAPLAAIGGFVAYAFFGVRFFRQFLRSRI